MKPTPNRQGDGQLPPTEMPDVDHASALRHVLRSRYGKPGSGTKAPPGLELVERLDRDDGEEWLQTTLSQEPFAAFGSAASDLLDGTATLKQLVALKDRGKKLFIEDVNDEQRLRGMAAYFLALGAALAHYGTVITTQSRSSVDAMLLELATVLPNPWAEMLNRALTRAARE